MAERTNALVLKTSVVKATEGSNPSLSATRYLQSLLSTPVENLLPGEHVSLGIRTKNLDGGNMLLQRCQTFADRFIVAMALKVNDKTLIP